MDSTTNEEQKKKTQRCSFVLPQKINKDFMEDMTGVQFLILMELPDFRGWAVTFFKGLEQKEGGMFFLLPSDFREDYSQARYEGELWMGIEFTSLRNPEAILSLIELFSRKRLVEITDSIKERPNNHRYFRFESSPLFA